MHGTKVRKHKNMKTKNPVKQKKIQSFLEKFEPKKENLIQILHHVQNKDPYNYISELVKMQYEKLQNI